ncbi:hypothetical protein DFH09DRAFT_1081468 [Mycena vulgaris]|nr:hypothetical protein DFH09DRAFT_1081468 [Mycena vulgaris]
MPNYSIFVMISDISEDLRLDYTREKLPHSVQCTPTSNNSHSFPASAPPRLRSPIPLNYAPVVTMLRARRRGPAAASPVQLATFELHLAGARTWIEDTPLPRGIALEDMERLVEGGFRVRIHGPDLEGPLA